MKKFDTFQEFMDWSVQKIVDQGGQCVDDEGGCEYSDRKGRHCLIGWHLPEWVGLASKDTNVRGVIDDFPEECKHLSHFDIGELANAQAFHDADSQLSRKTRLQTLVNQYNLDPSPPQYQQWIDMGI